MKKLILAILLLLSISASSQILKDTSIDGTVEIRNKNDLVARLDSSDRKWAEFVKEWRKKYGWMDSIHPMSPRIDLYIRKFDYYKEVWSNVDSLDKYDSLRRCTITCHYNYDSLRYYTAMAHFYDNEAKYYYVLEYGLKSLEDILTPPKVKKEEKSKCKCDP